MSDRTENRAWLEREAARYPGGWEDQFVTEFGMEGALDLLAVQGGDPFGVNLTHRPFAGNEALKMRVREARAAVSEMIRLAYVVGWEAMRDE